MSKLKQLIEDEKYEEILMLNSPYYDKYKVIAAIHLKRYRDAIFFIHGNTFEKAYCFYKLKKFDRALKILRKQNGERVNLLKSQCLYFMGKMKDAYEALRRCKLEDETAVNLYAMEAMNALASNEYSSIFALREDVKIAEPITYEFNSIECKMEGDFNRNYANIANETEYLGKLTFLDKEYDVANSYIKKQLGCIVNDEHNLSLTKKQAETFTYNKVTGFTLSEPVLFQHNFIKTQETEYNLLEDDRSLSKKKCFTTRLVLKWLVRNMEKKGAKLSKEKRNGMVKWALTHIDEREKWIIDCLNLILVDEGSSEYKELAKSVCCKLK